MSASKPDDSQVRALVQQVERAFAAGRREEGARLLAQAQVAAADHPLVLNAAGVHALNSGDPATARQRLERATQVDGKNPALWLNLASTFRKLGLPKDEMKALEKVLALEPRHLLALLQKASLLDIQDRPRQAAVIYQNALATIPPGTQLPQALRPAIQRAVDAVRENNAALEVFLGQHLQPERARVGTTTQARFDHCLAMMLGKRKLYMPQPLFMHFPHLPAYEFYPRDDFPWLAQVEAATAEIRTEFERVFAEDRARLEPYIAYPEGVPLDQWAELNHSRRWSVFYLWRNAIPVQEHLARCPKTAALLEKLPRADVPAHAPTAFFSILDARARIPPHTGVTNTRLIVHVPLIVPGQCGFRVGAETREWRSGEAWVFDDTIEHEAWNDSDIPRALLIFDVWNPYLSDVERRLVRAATKSIAEYYHDPGS
jgi:aspartyl/asparaginyl beta-hydroxylase (cupin superfamily)/Flp pilus assembly protein TadD